MYYCTMPVPDPGGGGGGGGGECWGHVPPPPRRGCGECPKNVFAHIYERLWFGGVWGVLGWFGVSRP